jgi:hypothetical protein
MSLTIDDLKNKIYGYYYVNASKEDKTVNVWFQFTETEAYYLQFVFPKCKISYITFYYNQAQELVYDFMCDNNLQGAMEKTAPFLGTNGLTPEDRRAMIIVSVEDSERRSIQYITEDENDKTYDPVLFNLNGNCKLTDAGKTHQEIIRQDVLDGNAGTLLLSLMVDGPEGASIGAGASGASASTGAAAGTAATAAVGAAVVASVAIAVAAAVVAAAAPVTPSDSSSSSTHVHH